MGEKWLINWPICYDGPYCFWTTGEVLGFCPALVEKRKNPPLALKYCGVRLYDE